MSGDLRRLMPGVGMVSVLFEAHLDMTMTEVQCSTQAWWLVHL